MTRKLTPDERLAWLANLGLSESEARAYVALLDGGAGPASEVAKRSRVPRNRVYDVLESLAAKDLVDIHLESVRTFTARPVGRYLAERRAALARHRAGLEEKRGALRAMFGAPATGASDEPAGVFRLARGRRDATDALVRLLRSAEHRVLAWTTSTTLTRLDNHATGSEVLPALVAKGLDVRLLVAPEDAPVPEALSGVVRRTADRPGAHRFLVDGRECAFLMPGADDDRVYVGDDLLLLTDSAALVRESAESALARWHRRAPAAEGGTWSAEHGAALLRSSVAASRRHLFASGAAVARVLAEDHAALQKAARRGARVRAMFPVQGKGIELARKLADVAEVRHAPATGLDLVIADDDAVEVTTLGGAARHFRLVKGGGILHRAAEAAWETATPLAAHLEQFAADQRTVAVRAVANEGEDLPAIAVGKPAKLVLASGSEADQWARPGRRMVVVGDAGARAGMPDPPLLLGAALVGDHAYFWPYRRRAARAVASPTLIEVLDDRLIGALEERFESLSS